MTIKYIQGTHKSLMTLVIVMSFIMTKLNQKSYFVYKNIISTVRILLITAMLLNELTQCRSLYGYIDVFID